MKVNQTDLYLFLLFQRLSQHSRIVPGFDIVETVFFPPSSFPFFLRCKNKWASHDSEHLLHRRDVSADERWKSRLTQKEIREYPEETRELLLFQRSVQG